MTRLFDSFKSLLNRRLSKLGSKNSVCRKRAALRLETLESRKLLTTAIQSGDWFDPQIWDDGVPTETSRAIIGQGVTVQLDGKDHFAKELVIQGNLVVPEEAAEPDKTLKSNWIHVNSGGVFQVGTEGNRYDDGTFTVELNGTDTSAMFDIPGAMMHHMHNNGFLMTASGGSVQFFGDEKLSFTKLATTAEKNSSTITVENVIERNFVRGAMNGDEFVTSAQDDGSLVRDNGTLAWEVGDQIVIASSSYDYTEEEVRTIQAIVNNNNGSSTITLNSPLNHKHYGAIESYEHSPSKTYEIDMRAEVALLSRNVKVQGLASQDTDAKFGDRSLAKYKAREVHSAKAPPTQVENGVGGHIMIMPMSGPIVIDGVQLDRLGQASRQGRYPIHWHGGGNRPNDVLKNSSITNSNNRGVTIHATSGLNIEGVVLHDIHGHGFFLEDAVEQNNVLVGNLVMGIHTVGGDDDSFSSPGTKDPFVVDTHDGVRETGSRFSSSAGFWITHPNNTFVGNIVAGAGDQRKDNYAEPEKGVAAGTGFWYAIPRTALGEGAKMAGNENLTPIFGEFGQFDYNTSHTTSVGLNFDRGSDIEDASGVSNLDSIQSANEYSPREGGVKSGAKTVNVIKGFTNYKATGAAMYHRGDAESIQFEDLRIADSYNGPWAVSENLYTDSLFVGHSRFNADKDAKVGGPRLYDGAGLYTGTHFAGFADPDAFAFQVEGSSFGPTMYHAFRETTFENDGTADHIGHAISDFQRGDSDPIAHKLGHPYQWIKGAIDLDGTLTTGLKDIDGKSVAGGVGYSIVPKVDFLIDSGDTLLKGGDAYLTNDIYARVQIQNKDDGEALFPDDDKSGKPLIRFTAQRATGENSRSVDVLAGQNINKKFYWSQIATKADSDGNNFVDDTLVVEFMRKGVPTNGFVLKLNNQDGDRPSLSTTIQDRVNAARIVTKLIGAGNYTPNIGTEVASEQALRSATERVAYFRDNAGNLFLNTFITDQPSIQLQPGAPLQTKFPAEIPTIAIGKTIQAEEFDNGIDGIAYHDSDATNTQGSFRGNTGVDVTENHVTQLMSGEWLEYTAFVVPLSYKIGVNLTSTSAGGQIRVMAGESNSAGYFTLLDVLDVPSTNGQSTTVWTPSVDMTFLDQSRPAVIRLEFVGNLANDTKLDSLQFAASTQTAYQPHSITRATVPTRIDFEHYDHGGQLVAYFDDSPGNTRVNDNFRLDEDVDASSILVTNEVFDGEWLEYTTDIAAGIYNVTMRKSWGGPDTGVKLYVASANSASESEFTLLGELVGQGEFLTLENVDMSAWAGSDRVLRAEIVGNWMGLDYLQFTATALDQTPPTADIVDVSPDPRNSNAGVVTIDFSEDVTGIDISDLLLTRSGNIVDISGAKLTQVSPKQYSVDLSSIAQVDGEYELKLKSSDSGIRDLAGNSLAADAVDQFLIDMTGPRVESVVINDGSLQRSMVSSITVNFSEVVNGVDANSFILTNATTNTQVVPIVTTQTVNGKTIATLTFSGNGIIGGSLADGNYTLTTLASTLTDRAGNQLDGNRDGVSGDDATDSFFRLFGDSNGDRRVNIVDFYAFRNALRGIGVSVFDYNGDGVVNMIDYVQFRSRQKR